MPQRNLTDVTTDTTWGEDSDREDNEDIVWQLRGLVRVSVFEPWLLVFSYQTEITTRITLVRDKITVWSVFVLF